MRRIPRTWFLSDLHFSHKSILRYSKRTRGGCKTVEEMNEWLIDKWNSTISEGDTVYFLGDFSFGNIREIRDEILPRLNGNIIFIRGNHDRNKTVNMLRNQGYEVHDLLTIKIGEQQIVLCHYPMEEWMNKKHGAWHLHGHIHNSNSQERKVRKMNGRFNVNFDMEGKIYSLDDIEQECTKPISAWTAFLNLIQGFSG